MLVGAEQGPKERLGPPAVRYHAVTQKRQLASSSSHFELLRAAAVSHINGSASSQVVILSFDPEPSQAAATLVKRGLGVWLEMEMERS